eukprot:CAMPEP_0198583312 /NCGR_PEP_ID=MMETSP1462-20131121/126588_1 /TAXON_ID=1333877 /ORGANISM="Brandtodinium nutriculum, Strain RCC3387" /LENGTH=341 /DNA_ID=CAMNT_0044314721 /DNA_START=36 /DNA_END=1058 /DNA_ORIENTATION=-
MDEEQTETPQMMATGLQPPGEQDEPGMIVQDGLVDDEALHDAAIEGPRNLSAWHTMPHVVGHGAAAVSAKTGGVVLVVGGVGMGERLPSTADVEVDVYELRKPRNSIRVAGFSPDGEQAVVCDSSKQTLKSKCSWSMLEHDAPLRRWSGPRSPPMKVVFSPDGKRFLILSENSEVQVWNVAAGSPNRTMKLNSATSLVWSAVFTPDGERILSVDWEGITSDWDVATGSLVRTLPLKTDGEFHMFTHAVYSPGGERILTGVPRGAKVWNATTGEVIASLNGHTVDVWSAAFSPCGRRVLTASVDHTAKLWDAWSGQLLATLKGHSAAVRVAAFLPDGRRALT